MLKIVLDTNDINAYKTQPILNYIENCAQKGLAEIFYGGDSLTDLLKEGNQGNPIRLHKFHSKEKVLSIAQFDFSFFGSCYFGDKNDSDINDSLSTMIFDEKWSELNHSSKVDIKLLEAAIGNNMDYLVTEDKKILEKSEAISHKYGLQIVDRNTMAEILKSLF